MTPIPFRGPWLPPPTATRAAPEYVVFTMRRPGCGRDAKWRAEREDDKSLVVEAECTREEGAA